MPGMRIIEAGRQEFADLGENEMNDDMKHEANDQPLPDYEVEFIPAERRLNDRRGVQASSSYTGPERRAGPRRDRRTSDVQSGSL